MTDDTDCPICYEELQYDLTTTICQHTFHQHCLQQWLNKSNICPICKTELQSKPNLNDVDKSNYNTSYMNLLYNNFAPFPPHHDIKPENDPFYQNFDQNITKILQRINDI